MGVKTYLQKRILNKEAQRNKREKQMKNLLDMRSLLVVCSVASLKEWEKWKIVFSNATLKEVEVLAFVNTEKMPLEKDAGMEPNVIYPKQLNWLGRMKNEDTLRTFVDKKYDLLIDLNFDYRFILNWVFIKSQAGLKVGSNHRKTMLEHFDLIIKTESAKDKPKLYIDQVFYFLQNINKNGDS